MLYICFNWYQYKSSFPGYRLSSNITSC